MVNLHRKVAILNLDIIFTSTIFFKLFLLVDVKNNLSYLNRTQPRRTNCYHIAGDSLKSHALQNMFKTTIQDNNIIFSKRFLEYSALNHGSSHGLN